MKKRIAWFLALIMSLGLLAGCGSGDTSQSQAPGSNSSAPQKTVLNVAQINDIATLGPYDAANMGSFNVLPMVYQGLFERDGFASDTLLPMIGKEYTVSDDGLTVTVEMFDYVKDSAGNDIDADDVLFCYDYMKGTGRYESVLKYVEAINKLGQYTVEFKLTGNEVGYYANLLACKIVDSGFDEITIETQPVGTGPYIVTDFSPSSSMTLEKNPNWWQTDEAYIHPENAANPDVIKLKMITESAQVPIALESGDVDLTTGITFANAKSFFMNDDGSAIKGYNVFSWDSQLIRNIMFNMSGQSVLSDNLALRQAICYAINNEELVQGVLQGGGTTLHAYGTSVYGDYNEKWDSEDYYDYNVEKAKEKLAEAGYQPGEVSIRIVSQTNDNFKKASEMIQQYLNTVGINVEIIQYDAALYTTYRGDFAEWDILLDNQANSAAMVSIWANFLSTKYTQYNGEGVNCLGSKDPELERLVTTANTPEGHTAENVDAAHYYIKDNALVYGLWAEKSYTVAQEGVSDIYLNSKLYLQPSGTVLADGYQTRSK